MEALILSCGTGGGHNAAAYAVQEELLHRGHGVALFNPYTLKSDALANTVNQAYIKTAQKSPRAFGAIYRLGDAYRKLPWRSPVYHLNRSMVARMEQYLSEHPVDVVLMPHLFPAEIFTQMRLHGHPVPKTILIATDYVCTPFQEEVLCDAYIVPAPDLIADFADRGIPREKIYPFGIPVRHAFRQPEEKRSARAKLALPEQSRIILVAGGSIGGGHIMDIIRPLSSRYQNTPDTHFVVICGNNQSVCESLRAAYGDHMTILSQTDQMASYLAACDIFITKPGGLSSTEAAVLGVPLIHINPIPGCETCNMEYFARRGMCLPVRTPAFELIDAIETLSLPENCEHMVKSQHEHINARATLDICDLAEQLIQQ